MNLKMKNLFNMVLRGLLPGLFMLTQGCGPTLPDEVQAAYETLPGKVDFNYHIRPILSDRCWSCHGPDANSRKADLRLDTEEAAFAALADGRGNPFVAGNLGRSEAFLRLITDDPERVMPPPEAHLELTPREIALIAKWIKQGAEWKEHWAFIPPAKPEVPQLHNEWKRNNEIDHFVQQQLMTEGLAPTEPANKTALLRRVSQDLTGLPPTLPEIDAFLADDDPDAYERAVDRLMASSAYAERMAVDWMDVARYGDSHGLHADGARYMWPWRDWVIEAFDQNMPYDQFVTWQLAGDLLPNATQSQILATAFNRNHPISGEGGVIEEEFRLEYVFDRANTVGTTLMGLTMECARCHDHKFDPISQKEYYQLAAFFNNIDDLGMIGDDGNYGPMLLLTTESDEQRLRQLEANIETQAAALETVRQQAQAVGRYVQQLPKPAKAESFERFAASRQSAGKVGRALRFEGEYDAVSLKGFPQLNEAQPATVMLWANTGKRAAGKTQTLAGNSGDKNNFWRGWDFFLDSLNRPSVRLIHSLPHNLIHVHALDSIPQGEWHHLAFSYDGSMQAGGIQLMVDGQAVPTTALKDQLYKNIYPIKVGNHQPDDRPLKVGRSGRVYTGEDGVFVGQLDELKYFDDKLNAVEVAQLAGLEPTEGSSPVRRSAAYQAELAALTRLRQARVTLLDSIPEVMVMREMSTPRTMHVLDRGQYDQPLDPVQAGTPQSVLGFPEDLPRNRLGLAKWLFSSDNPLTARVAVNRYWQLFFGQGLVNTPHDFGSQGSLPTHPQLMDWLAVGFQASGWDVKALHKRIVMSATYQQDSRTRPKLQELDPANQWLARAPSYRLPAEMIRDNALAASGLLIPRVGGPSVKPYQPEGLWKEKSTFSFQLLEYKPDTGADLHRRSLYTFLRRTSPHPFMNIFDAPNRDRCVVQREITNTPLQALVLLNDPQFLEAARALAQRSLQEAGTSLDDQLHFAFRCVSSRSPSAKELSVFQAMYQEEYERFNLQPRDAKVYLDVGTYPLPNGLDLAQTAALAVVTHTMLNQDDAYMKR
jgi:cytochrome c553